MRTRDKSKAQLLRELKKQEHMINVLESEKERIKEEYNQVASDRGKLMEDMGKMAAEHDENLRWREDKIERLRKEAEATATSIRQLERQLHDVTVERNVARGDLDMIGFEVESLRGDKAYLQRRLHEKDQEHLQAEQQLMRQAVLAGDVAKRAMRQQHVSLTDQAQP